MDAYAKVDKASADASVARIFYANGLPFNAARSKEYQAMIDQVTRMPPGHKAPDYNKLRNEMLQTEKDRIEKDLSACVSNSAETGSDLTSDGWTDAAHRPLLNILLVTVQGAQFVQAHDTSGFTKSAEYIAGVLCDAIEAAGSENKVLVITDSAANCKAAGAIVEERSVNITKAAFAPS